MPQAPFTVPRKGPIPPSTVLRTTASGMEMTMQG
jgi:hypothetical protein